MQATDALAVRLEVSLCFESRLLRFQLLRKAGLLGAVARLDGSGLDQQRHQSLADHLNSSLLCLADPYR